MQELAEEIHGHVPPEVLPDTDNINSLMLIYAALGFAKGAEITNEDVHNGWAAWTCLSNPNHASIAPYDSLPADIQDQDTPFTEAIRKATS